MIKMRMELDVPGHKKVVIDTAVEPRHEFTTLQAHVDLFEAVSLALRDRVAEAMAMPVPERTQAPPAPQPHTKAGVGGVDEGDAARIVAAAREHDRKRKADVRGFGEI